MHSHEKTNSLLGRVQSCQGSKPRVFYSVQRLQQKIAQWNNPLVSFQKDMMYPTSSTKFTAALSIADPKLFCLCFQLVSVPFVATPQLHTLKNKWQLLQLFVKYVAKFYLGKDHCSMNSNIGVMITLHPFSSMLLYQNNPVSIKNGFLRCSILVLRLSSTFGLAIISLYDIIPECACMV